MENIGVSKEERVGRCRRMLASAPRPKIRVQLMLSRCQAGATQNVWSLPCDRVEMNVVCPRQIRGQSSKESSNLCVFHVSSSIDALVTMDSCIHIILRHMVWKEGKGRRMCTEGFRCWRGTASAKIPLAQGFVEASETARTIRTLAPKA